MAFLKRCGFLDSFNFFFSATVGGILVRAGILFFNYFGGRALGGGIVSRLSNKSRLGAEFGTHPRSGPGRYSFCDYSSGGVPPRRQVWRLPLLFYGTEATREDENFRDLPPAFPAFPDGVSVYRWRVKMAAKPWRKGRERLKFMDHLFITSTSRER